MTVPRRKTLNTMMYKNIPKYERFFTVYFRHLMTTEHKKLLQELVANGRRDDSSTLLADFNEGYCPEKWQALKYTPARVIMSNMYVWESEYDAVVKKMKANKR